MRDKWVCENSRSGLRGDEGFEVGGTQVLVEEGGGDSEAPGRDG